jgi:hypothetical protein
VQELVFAAANGTFFLDLTAVLPLSRVFGGGDGGRGSRLKLMEQQVLTSRKGGSKRPALQSDELQMPAYQA